MREWLREARKARGYTSQEMAKKLGLSLSYYSMIENGNRKTRMDIPLANKFAQVLDIPLGDVVRNETRR